MSKTKAESLENILKDLDEIKDLISAEIRVLQGFHTRIKGVRKLQSIKKKVENVKKKVPKLVKRKRQISNKNCDFAKLKTPSGGLANFLFLDENEQISRIEATRAICCYIRVDANEVRDEILKWKEKMNPDGTRNLQDSSNKNRILPDSKLSDALHYDEYKQDVQNGKIFMKRTQTIVKDDNLYYTTIQRLLTKLLT